MRRCRGRWAQRPPLSTADYSPAEHPQAPPPPTPELPGPTISLITRVGPGGVFSGEGGRR